MQVYSSSENLTNDYDIKVVTEVEYNDEKSIKIIDSNNIAAKETK